MRGRMLLSIAAVSFVVACGACGAAGPSDDVTEDGGPGGQPTPPSAGAGDGGGDGDGGATAEEGGAAGTDGAADGGPAAPSTCAGAGLALCDGFESGAIDTSVWTVDGLAPTVDSTFAARGTHALHLLVQPSSAKRVSRISETKTFPVANDSFFGRVFVYVANATPSFHMAFVWGAHEMGTESAYAIGTGNHDVLVNFKDPSVDQGVNDKKPFPVNRWVCVEWQFDGVGNVVNVWLDGVADPGATLGGYTAPVFDHLFVGMGLYSGTTPLTTSYEMWLDEVAVDATRVTCAR